MRALDLTFVCCLFVLSVVNCGTLAAKESQGETVADKQVAEVPPSDQPEKKSRKPKFFLSQSTTTYTDVILATVTVFSSCLRSVATGVAPCGRKKRRSLSFLDMNKNQAGR